MSVQRQIERLIVHRSAEWLEILRTGRTDQHEEFIRWISESPRHMEEFLMLLALSCEAREALSQSSIDRDVLLARLSPAVTRFRRGVDTPGELRDAPSQRRGLWATAIAASVTAIALFALWISEVLSPWQRFETDTGEHGQFALADGSVVELNARSSILVKIDNTSRDIRLIHGEGLFRVAHDTQRPFRVLTRDATVQAVGTQFDVATLHDATKVAVIEGKVRVSAAGGKAADRTGKSLPLRTAPLAAGEAAHVTVQGIERRSSEEAANAIAWRERRLVFERTALEHAVEEFNRYHDSTPLRLENIEPGSHHYSGTFNADDLRSFTDLLSRERGLAVEQRANEIVIRGVATAP
jgi:transmembrane sensor